MGNSCEVKEEKEFQHPSLCSPSEPELWGSWPRGTHPTVTVGCLTPSCCREAKPFPQFTQMGLGMGGVQPTASSCALLPGLPPEHPSILRTHTILGTPRLGAAPY